jgi:hypothetical protein
MRAFFSNSVAAFVFVTAVSCNAAGPSSSAINEFVEALRGRGFSIAMGGEISVANNGFFSVPARQGALIVLYVGCQADVVQGLAATLGAPVATGTTPCLGGF